jgi:hypothetical protein
MFGIGSRIVSLGVAIASRKLVLAEVDFTGGQTRTSALCRPNLQLC